MTIPAIFRPFISSTKSSFGYLTTDYGFREMTVDAAGPEAWVIYDNRTTRVTVHYELGAEPWVEIGRLEMRDGELVQPSSIGLELVLRERGAQLDDQIDVPREIGDAEIAQMVARRAERLRTSGDDLLRGDFRGFAKLQTKAEIELKRREAELFGAKE